MRSLRPPFQCLLIAMMLIAAAGAPSDLALAQESPVVNMPATAITTHSATVGAQVFLPDGMEARIVLYWGAADGDVTPDAWQRNEDLGERPAGNYAVALSDLQSSTRYYYRAYVENAYGSAWAVATSSFQTLLKPPSGIRDFAELFYLNVLGREPEGGAVDAWQQGYFDVATSADIDVRFVMREMGRQFFLSDEYAARNRSNETFISDCYRAFLLRDPFPSEVANWLADVDGEGNVRWNRGEVMTAFAESIEFARIVVDLFPGLSGEGVNNFVTRMYIGIFDRIPDTGGLTYYSDQMRNNPDKSAQAKAMALAFFNSEEGTAKAPDATTRVVRLYRAFLGRFPGDGEIRYWVGELENDRQNLESLIELFGNSAEFRKLLSEYFYNIVLPGNVKLELIRIPAGRFLMGSSGDSGWEYAGQEAPVHEVVFATENAFYMGKYEVTQRQWLAVMGSWPWKSPNAEYGVGDNYPAYNIDWHDAHAFIAALNTHVERSGQGLGNFRLPSEAEWEYACRAGSTTRFCFGDSDNQPSDISQAGELGEYAWFGGNNILSGPEAYGTKPVGLKKPNVWGLYDMHGNVYEWCQDNWHSNYYGAPTDGSAWSGEGLPLLRGGYWLSTPRNCRSANRNKTPDSRSSHIGLRVVRAQ